MARRPQGQAEPEEPPGRAQAPTSLPSGTDERRAQSPVTTEDGHDADATARLERGPATGQASQEPAGGGRKAKTRQRKGPFSFLKELPALIVIAFVLALLIKSFLVQAFYIPSESMEPTLKPGDRVLVNKVVYHLHPPRRGDVIVFRNPNPGEEPHRGIISGFFHWITEGLGVSAPEDEDFIKRVIGLPGDSVEERTNGDIYVNGRKLDEPYLKGPKDVRPQGLPVWHVPPGELFVLGDNRTNSNDSRFGLGYIPIDRVVGKAFIIIWPPSRFGGLAGGTHFAPR